MGKSIKTNYIYNLLYQLTAVLLPLITMPYVSRVLGVEGVGINALTNANTQYFILIGSLGISIYATKKIAIVREDKRKLKTTFIEIFILQCIGCLISYTIFFILLVRNNKYSLYYSLQGLFILASAIDISWYFLGVEEFKKASIRSFFVKVTSVILIFIFINDSSDLPKYIFINSFTMLIGQFVMLLYVDKSVLKAKHYGNINILRHLKPALIMFIPQVASQVYTVLDKTMLGAFATTIEVGYYDQSQKIVRLLLTLVTSLGTVMLPRIANLHGKGEKEEIKKYLLKAFCIISFLALPITFGIISISDKFIPMYFGNEYLPVVSLTNFSVWMVLIIGFGNVFGTQYLLAVGKTKEYTFSVILGAIVNFLLNLLLIPNLLAKGAVIATLCAELSIAAIQFYFARRIFSINWIKQTYKYWISAIVMFILVKQVGYIDTKRSILIFIQIVIGGITYISILFIIKDRILLKAIDSIKKKLNK